MELVVLVTGCSGGFGELIARTLARAGYVVYATMRATTGRNQCQAQTLRAWAQEQGLRLSILDLDVTDDASVTQAVTHVLNEVGRIDVVVNNAATSSLGPLEAFSLAQVEQLFNNNVFGPVRVNKAVLPHMRERRSGLIVEITSAAGRVMRWGGLYPSTKWAQEGLAESLHNDLAQFDIDVVIVEPGSYPTEAAVKAMVAEEQDILAAYAEEPSALPPSPQPSADYVPPDPQEVADAVKALLEMPAGRRPLRTVVGKVLTEGVAAYNAAYERARTELRESARRPDQATPWF